MNILKECVRHKILNVLIVFAVALLGGSMLLKELSSAAEQRTLIDTGYAGVQVFGFLTVLLSVAIMFFEETEMRSIWMVLSKPVSRTDFIIGKFFGISLTLFFNVLLMSVIIFVMCFLYGVKPDWNFPLVIFFLYLQLVIIAAIALLFSVVTTSLPTALSYTFLLYVIGLLSHHIKLLAAKPDIGPLNKGIVYFIYYSVPHLDKFNLKDLIYSFKGAPDAVYFVKLAAYFAVYCAMAMFLTAHAFSKKEL